VLMDDGIASVDLWSLQMSYDYYKLVRSESWYDGGFRGATERWWNRSPSKPWVEALAFQLQSTYITSSYTSEEVFHPSPVPMSRLNNDTIRNQAYEKMMSEIGSPSSWGTNLAEAHQSVSTIEKRLQQLGFFAKQLRQKNFYGAAEALGYFGQPAKVSNRKAFADNFLEYHFGWEPAIKDIYDALQTLSKADFGSKKVKGSSHGLVDVMDREDYGPGQFTVDHLRSTLRYKTGCIVQISNESAFLASQLGLVNPATVAWDLIPYSFVVGWFVNVDQVLQAMTGFVGLNLWGAYSTESQESTFTRDSASYKVEDGNVVPVTSGFTQSYFLLNREPGIAGPTLVLKPFKGFSVVRGLTAISLLLQKL